MCWRHILIYTIRFSLIIGSPASSIENVNFQVAPSSINVSVGEQATFYCRYPAASLVGWLVNDTTLNILDNNDVTTRSGDTHELNIVALGKYNQTNITCLAVVNDVIDYSSPATLLIQATLDAVKNIRRNVSVITWLPPFSLDLTGIDPDIAYCVEIYNISCGMRDLVTDECSVFEPYYYVESTIIALNQGFTYETAVTPRNNVDGAKNGTSLSIRDKFVFARDALLYIKDIIQSPGTFVVSVIFEIQFITEVSIENMVIPSEYVISIMPTGSNASQFLYTNTRNVVYMSQTESTTILEVNTTLPAKQLWDVTVLANGCKENPLTTRLELSTHEVQQISLTTSSDGILLFGRYTDQSTAVGILVLIYSLELEDDSNVHYLVVLRTAGERNISATLGGISAGPYYVSVFTIEDDGLPFSTIVTEVRRIVVESTVTNDYTSKVLFELQYNSDDNTVCITCTFLDSSTTDCVAVVHQRISQLSSSGLMNIESSYNFNRSGDTAYGCIKRVNTSLFQIGIIGAKQRDTILQARGSPICTIECIVGSGVGTAIIVIVMITIVGVLVVCWIRNRGYMQNNVGYDDSVHNARMNIKTEVNSAYEVISLANPKVPMKQNSAYEHVVRYTST